MTMTRSGAPTANIVLVELSRGGLSRFTTESTFDTRAAWTPDGSRVLYGSDRAGGRKICWKRADGVGGEEKVSEAPSLFNDPNSVTPDGRVLVFRSLSGQTAEDLWTAPLTGDHPARPLLQTKANELDASFSPDGRWIAYRSDESGQFEIYVQPFPSLDRKFRASLDGAVLNTNATFGWTAWRSDGRELYYIGRDGRTIMAVPVEPGPELRLGTAWTLLRLPPEVRDVGISRDGQRFVVAVANEAGGGRSIQLLMNWSQTLGEKR
jgi:Tol biopolymer transport system component